MATSNIYYAIEIDTGGSDTDATIGLNNGTIRCITDRPGYDGSPTYPTLETGGDITDIWYEGIIERGGIGNVTRSCTDLDISGGYGTISNFSVSMVNAMKFWKKLDDIDLNLIGKYLQLYIVIDDVFYYAYYGQVDSLNYDETKFIINCSSPYKTLHKTIPPNHIDESTYPNAEESSKGNPIPVCFGYNNNAKILSTVQKGKYKVLSTVGEEEYTTAPVSFYSEIIVSGERYPYIGFETTGISFEAFAFDGMYVTVTNGTGSDIKDFIKIVSSYSTQSGITKMYLERQLSKNPTDAANDGNIYSSGANKDTWFVKISTSRYSGIVSNEYLNSIDDTYNQIPIKTWNEDKLNYDLGFGVVNSIGDNGERDIVNLNTSTLTEDEEIDIISNYGNNSSSDKISTGNSYDDDRTTYTDTDGSNMYNTGLEINISEELIQACIEGKNIYLGIDADLQLGDGQTGTLDISLDDIIYESTDIYSNSWTYDSLSITSFSFGDYTDLSYRGANFIPNDYYGQNGDSNDEYSFFGKFDISGVELKDQLLLPDDVRDSIATGILDTFTVKVRYLVNSGNLGCDIRLKNVTLFGVNTESLQDGNFYLKCIGEDYVSGSTVTLPYTLFHLIDDYDGISYRDYDNILSTRNSWAIGRQLIESKNSFNYLRELLRTSFIEAIIKRSGQLQFTSYRDLDTSVATFDQDNIIRDSIKSWQLTNLSNVYNEFVINYNWNPGLQDYDRVLSITKVDESTFPGQYESSGGSDSTDSSWDVVGSNDKYTFVLEFPSNPSGTYSVGDVISYAADDTSYYFKFGKITWVLDSAIGGVWYVYGSTNDVRTTEYFYNGTGSYPVSSSSGVLTIHGTHTPKWKTFAGGFENYGLAKSLWEMAHDSYSKTGVVNTLPETLSKCPWFVDENLYTAGSSNGASYSYSAYKYLSNLLNYVTRQKNRVVFDIPINSTNITRELIDYITFSDTIYTDGDNYNGYIEKITIRPQDNTMTVTCLLVPSDLPDSGIIEETTTAPDTITETTVAPDTITEV